MLTSEQIARVCHAANRELQLIQGDAAPSPAWDEAAQWQRDPCVNGVVAALAGAKPRELHQEWLGVKRADGWTYGPVKDAVARTHPCLVAYEDLPDGQKLKDVLFCAIVEALTGEQPQDV